MRVTLNRLKKEYQDAMQAIEENGEVDQYQYIDEVIGYRFWGLKKIVRAFEKYIGSEHRPNRINPNPYDTPTYYLMKPSEQANVEGMFMDEVLRDKRQI